MTDELLTTDIKVLIESSEAWLQPSCELDSEERLHHEQIIRVAKALESRLSAPTPSEQFDRDQGPRYGAELDKAAELLQKVHPMGAVKAFGRLEVAAALTEVLARLSAPAQGEGLAALGEIVKMARLGAGQGLRQFCERIGCKPSELCALENGREAPPELLAKIAPALRPAWREYHDELAVARFLAVSRSRLTPQGEGLWRIKPLEWKPSSLRSQPYRRTAETIFGILCVNKDTEAGHFWAQDIDGEFGSLEAAKLAAEEHYRARLTPSLSPAGEGEHIDLAALVERVEAECGMGAPAWDTIDPKQIVAAVLKCAASPSPLASGEESGSRGASPEVMAQLEARQRELDADLAELGGVIASQEESRPTFPGDVRGKCDVAEGPCACGATHDPPAAKPAESEGSKSGGIKCDYPECDFGVIHTCAEGNDGCEENLCPKCNGKAVVYLPSTPEGLSKPGEGELQKSRCYTLQLGDHGYRFQVPDGHWFEMGDLSAAYARRLSELLGYAHLAWAQEASLPAEAGEEITEPVTEEWLRSIGEHLDDGMYRVTNEHGVELFIWLEDGAPTVNFSDPAIRMPVSSRAQLLAILSALGIQLPQRGEGGER